MTCGEKRSVSGWQGQTEPSARRCVCREVNTHGLCRGSLCPAGKPSLEGLSAQEPPALPEEPRWDGTVHHTFGCEPKPKRAAPQNQRFIRLLRDTAATKKKTSSSGPDCAPRSLISAGSPQTNPAPRCSAGPAPSAFGQGKQLLSWAQLTSHQPLLWAPPEEGGECPTR